MNGKQLVAEALQAVLPDWSLDDIDVKIERPKDEKLGDYAFPTFTLAKTMRKAPNLIAAELAEKIVGEQLKDEALSARVIDRFMDELDKEALPETAGVDG